MQYHIYQVGKQVEVWLANDRCKQSKERVDRNRQQKKEEEEEEEEEQNGCLTGRKDTWMFQYSFLYIFSPKECIFLCNERKKEGKRDI